MSASKGEEAAQSSPWTGSSRVLVESVDRMARTCDGLNNLVSSFEGGLSNVRCGGRRVRSGTCSSKVVAQRKRSAPDRIQNEIPARCQNLILRTFPHHNSDHQIQRQVLKLGIYDELAEVDGRCGCRRVRQFQWELHP